MKNLAIIPARGGSKRIPKKNKKDFLGKPIIAYSIQTAIGSKMFDEIMVSTEDKEIAEIAQEYGAKVPFLRSNQNSGDFATLADVIEEVKDTYEEKQKYFDNICCILPTAPLISFEALKSAYELLVSNSDIDSVKPVVRFSYPIQRALRLIDGKVEMIQKEHLKNRSQDLEPTFHDAGQFYWMKYSSGLKGENKYGIEISEVGVQDIDTQEDWELAEIKYKYLNRLG